MKDLTHTAAELIAAGYPAQKYKDTDYTPDGVTFKDSPIIKGHFFRKVYIGSSHKGTIYLANYDSTPRFAVETPERLYKMKYFTTYRGAVNYIVRHSKTWRNLFELSINEIMGG